MFSERAPKIHTGESAEKDAMNQEQLDQMFEQASTVDELVEAIRASAKDGVFKLKLGSVENEIDVETVIDSIRKGNGTLVADSRVQRAAARIAPRMESVEKTFENASTKEELIELVRANSQNGKFTLNIQEQPIDVETIVDSIRKGNGTLVADSRIQQAVARIG